MTAEDNDVQGGLDNVRDDVTKAISETEGRLFSEIRGLIDGVRAENKEVTAIISSIALW